MNERCKPCTHSIWLRLKKRSWSWFNSAVTWSTRYNVFTVVTFIWNYNLSLTLLLEANLTGVWTYTLVPPTLTTSLSILCFTKMKHHLCWQWNWTTATFTTHSIAVKTFDYSTFLCLSAVPALSLTQRSIWENNAFTMLRLQLTYRTSRQNKSSNIYRFYKRAYVTRTSRGLTTYCFFFFLFLFFYTACQ